MIFFVKYACTLLIGHESGAVKLWEVVKINGQLDFVLLKVYPNPGGSLRHISLIEGNRFLVIGRNQDSEKAQYYITKFNLEESDWDRCTPLKNQEAEKLNMMNIKLTIGIKSVYIIGDAYKERNVFWKRRICSIDIVTGDITEKIDESYLSRNLRFESALIVKGIKKFINFIFL